MPRYGYRCAPCEKEHDIWHKMSEVGNDQLCPDCKSLLKRVYHPVNFEWGNQYANPHIDRKAALINKAYIEKNADRIRRGEVEYIPAKGLPKGLQPDLGK